MHTSLFIIFRYEFNIVNIFYMFLWLNKLSFGWLKATVDNQINFLALAQLIYQHT